MAFIRPKYKVINEKEYGPYYYLVKTYREGDKVKQEQVYLGKDPSFRDIPEDYKDDVRGHPMFVRKGVSKNDGRYSDQRRLDSFDPHAGCGRSVKKLNKDDVVRIKSLDRVGIIHEIDGDEYVVRGILDESDRVVKKKREDLEPV